MTDSMPPLSMDTSAWLQTHFSSLADVATATEDGRDVPARVQAFWRCDWLLES